VINSALSSLLHLDGADGSAEQAFPFALLPVLAMMVELGDFPVGLPSSSMDGGEGACEKDRLILQFLSQCRNLITAQGTSAGGGGDSGSKSDVVVEGGAVSTATEKLSTTPPPRLVEIL
jgi:hypothetical protein